MNVEHVPYSHFCIANRPIFFNTQTCYLPEYSYPKIPKICDPILVTLLKMQPIIANPVVKRPHPAEFIPISLLLGSAPPPPPPGGQGINTFSIKASVKALVRKKKRRYTLFVVNQRLRGVFIKSLAIKAIIGLSVLERCLCLSSKD